MTADRDGLLPDWSYAAGRPSARAAMRRRPEDFRVVEELDPAFDPDGQHDYLLIEKSGRNTEQVQRLLAKFAGLPRSEVGFSGMKDRHARTRQWFSVPRRAQHGADWSQFVADGVEILRLSRHRRKLRRGAHRGNRFRIVLRALDDPEETLPARLEGLAASGAPNYFGPQRFGRGGANVALAERLFAGRRLPRPQRAIALSAARSLIFNELLSARVADGSWDRLQPGDVAGLDGSRSIFALGEVDDAQHGRGRRAGTAGGRGARFAVAGSGGALRRGAPALAHAGRGPCLGSVRGSPDSRVRPRCGVLCDRGSARARAARRLIRRLVAAAPARRKAGFSFV